MVPMTSGRLVPGDSKEEQWGGEGEGGEEKRWFGDFAEFRVEAEVQVHIHTRVPLQHLTGSLKKKKVCVCLCVHMGGCVDV